MTEICEKFALPARINVLKFQNDKTGELVGVCTEFEKTAKPLGPTAHRGLQHSATTCCPRYPSGSTVLECRLEGDQPVAHVVQVPADGNTATQKMCLLLETKQSPSGPLSRIISRPKGPEDCPEECGNGTCNSTASPGTTYCLESLTRPGGATALASMVPTDSSNLVTALETTKVDKDGNRPYSRILYGPAEERIAEASSCEANSRDPPVTFIDCTASRKGTLARVTKCFNEIASREKNYYETNVEDGDPTAVGYQRPSQNDACRRDVFETRVDKHGPRTRLINHPTDCKRYCGYMESKASCDGPSARIIQAPGESVYEQKYLATGPAARDDVNERRNGLDPSENKKSIPVKTRVSCLRPTCPPKACASLENSQSESNSVDQVQLDYTGSIRCEPIKPVTQPEAAKVPVEEQCKTKELVDCDSSKLKDPKARSKPGYVPALKETSDCASNHVPRIEPQELLTCYRDYVPSTLLERYEACRSKRNGLQDQCFLPVPRAVIELKKNEAISRNCDHRDLPNNQNADCQSVGTGHTLVTPPASIASGFFENMTELMENVC
ncbi:uncharacterized protein LOC117218759 [Megalopta genalis]|uniref:uncharacterized protein LOC117218759 n=1 Tax=Megalopta genalis TaxID=115081 RepID=UPI003FD2F245